MSSAAGKKHRRARIDKQYRAQKFLFSNWKKEFFATDFHNIFILFCACSRFTHIQYFFIDIVQIYPSQNGVINYFLSFLGIDPVGW